MQKDACLSLKSSNSKCHQKRGQHWFGSWPVAWLKRSWLKWFTVTFTWRPFRRNWIITTFKMAEEILRNLGAPWVFNSYWPSGAIYRHKFRSTLAQVMARCLTAPSHYLNQCWLDIIGIHPSAIFRKYRVCRLWSWWHSLYENFNSNVKDIKICIKMDGWFNYVFICMTSPKIYNASQDFCTRGLCCVSLQSILFLIINSPWPYGAMWRQWSESTLDQIMACNLMAPSCQLIQCWHIISWVLWHLSETDFRKCSRYQFVQWIWKIHQ